MSKAEWNAHGNPRFEFHRVSNVIFFGGRRGWMGLNPVKSNFGVNCTHMHSNHVFLRP